MNSLVHNLTELLLRSRLFQTVFRMPLLLEDNRFYEHNGIDPKGIVRALFVGLSHGGNFSEGASTITQQLIKLTVFLTAVPKQIPSSDSNVSSRNGILLSSLRKR